MLELEIDFIDREWCMPLHMPHLDLSLDISLTSISQIIKKNIEMQSCSGNADAGYHFVISSLLLCFIALILVEIKLYINWIWTDTFVAVLTAEKLEWGNHDHLSNIIEKHPVGFDLILGADIYILLTFLCPCGYFQFWSLFSLFLMHISIAAFRGPWLAESFQQASIPCLFDTVVKLLRMQANKCRFILAYVSRTKVYVLFRLIIYVFCSTHYLVQDIYK